MRRLLSPLTLLALLAACAHDEPAADVDPNSVPVEGRFVLTGLARPVVALITQTGIQGPVHNLGRYDNGAAIRGTAYGKDVNITLGEASADGIVGRMPFNMQVTRTADGVTASGLILGAPSTFTFNKARINGAFGRCGYDVRFIGDGYAGPRSCGGSIQQVGITLPPILNTFRDIEVAVDLALLLGTRPN
jgi:hypothetical protein